MLFHAKRLNREQGLKNYQAKLTLSQTVASILQPVVSCCYRTKLDFILFFLLFHIFRKVHGSGHIMYNNMNLCSGMRYFSCRTIMFIDWLDTHGEHWNFILQTIHIKYTSVKVTRVWGCFLFFLVSKGGWMSLIVAITAVEHGGHHPPTQAIYICGCVLWLTERIATALTQGEEEEECEMLIGSGRERTCSGASKLSESSLESLERSGWWSLPFISSRGSLSHKGG